MRINVGCGGHPFDEPWINVDSSLGTSGFPCHPQILADVRDLPFTDESADAIYCGHLLEHVPLDEVPLALKEIRRVLKTEGSLCIVGPDYDRALAGWPEMCESIWPGIYHEMRDWEGSGHAWCATATNTLELVREVFPGAQEIPIADVDPDTWPSVSFLGWQFAILA